jgi:hypothetical protein
MTSLFRPSNFLIQLDNAPDEQQLQAPHPELVTITLLAGPQRPAQAA